MSLGFSFSAGNRVSASNLQAMVALLDAMSSFPVSAAGNDGTTTSTTYVNTLTGAATPLSLAFTALKSQHLVTVSCTVLNSGASGPWNQYMAFQVTGSGFTTYGPSDADSAYGQWTNNNVAGVGTRSTVVSGLTPGVSYTVTAFMRVGNSTGNFLNRRIVVE